MLAVNQSDTEFVFIYTPLPDEGTAERMAGALIKARLAACVNIYPGVRSIYEWQGEVQMDREVVAFIKTRAELAQEVISAARKLHPYEVPAFLILPIAGGNEDYMDWARGQIEH